MSGYLQTAATWAFSFWLTAALALAPAAGMPRHCMSGQAPGHPSMSDGEKAPINGPCKHCDDDGQQQSCKGHCSGMTVSIAPSAYSFEPLTLAARVIVHGTISPGDFQRSPEIPPPRLFPV